ncbi:MAG: alpha-L-glutamate ligase-like protein [Syntrophales bacterium]|nr:alpha-L-glutamate ligase-like protein [Syntrophales bacterium]
MMSRAFQKLKEAGVLGINSRNADYIMRCNARSSFPKVDNKIATKKLAEAYGIPTPALYYIVVRHGDIDGLQNALQDHSSFAVKPARGSGGSGIILVQGQTESGYKMQNGGILSFEDFRYHVSDILSGIFSLSGLEDEAIVEALIHPDLTFAAITYQGVPDVRIVVYRGVPVMAMVRLPTKASEGKANLHRGAIGAGIELATGMTITAVHLSRIITHHPNTDNPVNGIQVPYWEQMLITAARTFEMTGLGYIGVDLVIDRYSGPMLLELNARPGLAIQLANRQGLLRRLEQVDGAPPAVFITPEARVSWAREIFQV